MTTAKTASIEAFNIEFGYVTFHLLGSTPLIYNSMSAKAKEQLLHPRGRLNAADKVNNLKHRPADEYRDSTYRRKGDDVETRLYIPCANFKRAMADVALRIPGLKKTEIQQTLTVMGFEAPVWGAPALRMDVTRSADMGHTPDIRTRACLENWATTITVRYIKPNLNVQTIANLVQAAGMMMGVGDWRIGKGSGDHGQWEAVAETDERYLAVKQMGREVQDSLLESPEFFNEDTETLYSWYEEQIAHREETRGKGKADLKVVAA